MVVCVEVMAGTTSYFQRWLDSRGRSASDFDLDDPRSNPIRGNFLTLSLTLEISELIGVRVYDYPP